MPHVDPEARRKYQAAYNAKRRDSHREYRKVHYQANRERYIAMTKDYTARHPEINRAACVKYRAKPGHTERNKARYRTYRAENRSKVIARNQAWRDANREKQRKFQKAYRLANKAKYAAYAQHRRARKMNQLCECCTREEVEAVWLAAPDGHEVDHKLPLALGGLHCCRNLEVLTYAAHRVKTADDMRNIGAVRATLQALALA
jgi:hypothetical protein